MAPRFGRFGSEYHQESKPLTASVRESGKLETAFRHFGSESRMRRWLQLHPCGELSKQHPVLAALGLNR